MNTISLVFTQKKSFPTRVYWVLLALVLILPSCTGNLGQDKTLTDEEYLLTVAMSDEYREYRGAVRSLGEYFIRHGDIVQSIRPLSRATSWDDPASVQQYRDNVAELPGGAEYLAIKDREQRAITAYYGKFDPQRLTKKQHKEIGDIYKNLSR